MLFAGLFITIVLGIFISISISQKLKLIEVLGLAFPIGIGVQTFLMVILDLVGIKITIPSISAASILLIIGLCIYLFFHKNQVKEWFKYVSTFTYPKINLFWLLCIIAICALIVMNVAKTMYFPTFDTDSVRGFNLIGKGIGFEGTIKNLSLFKDVNYYPHTVASYISYTPLIQCSYAYVYIFGAEISKIVNALFFISFILTFYGVLSRFATHSLTAFVTFIVFLTPEMLAFSSLSGTNFIHAFYASLGILFFVAWYYKKIPSLLWIAAALLALNNWTRSEGLAFIGVACIILLWNSIKEKNYKNLIFFSIICFFPFVFWNIFLKINHLDSIQVFIMKPFWDAEKATVITTEVWALFKNMQYYGITFILFIIVLLSNIRNIIKGDQVVTLILLTLSVVFYTILIYQIDYIWDSILNVLHYSYKRFIFCFVPIVWFYIAANKNVKWCFDKLDNFLYK